MLKYRLIHPELLHALARSGHGSRILIADSNYPHFTGAPATATRIYLNLAPGLLSATDVLKVVLDAIPVEAAHAMLVDSGQAIPVPDEEDQAAPIVDEFRTLLPQGIKIQLLSRFEFYAAVNVPQTSVVIATGEQRLYANILLTIGVVAPNDL